MKICRLWLNRQAFATELRRRGALIAVRRRIEGQRPGSLSSPACRIEDPTGWGALAVVEALHAQCMGSGELPNPLVSPKKNRKAIEGNFQGHCLRATLRFKLAYSMHAKAAG